jgi:3-isopropylmalate/(R)-2-methylmalate dehydratase large subunit
MGMTIVEKILAGSAGKASVVPDEIVVVRADCVAFNDCLPHMLGGRELLKVHDPDKVIVVLDHFAPAPTAATANDHRASRSIVDRFGITRFHDLGHDHGILHAVVDENAYALPGTVFVSNDSHTCSAGAYNCAARGIGWPDMVNAVTTGEVWFKVCPTVRYDLEGELDHGASAKDIFLHIAGQFGSHTGVNVEFGGVGLVRLDMTARRTLATMAAELSCEFAVMEPDELLFDHLAQRTKAEFHAQLPDADAFYADRRRIDLGAIRPMIAHPDSVLKNSARAADVRGVKIDQAFIGSCANGNLEDLEIAAKVVTGRRIAKGVRLIVTPASQRIYHDALRLGYVTALAGAGAVVTNPTCGACGGFHMGALADGETCITASTRNFKGRMGSAAARIYMGSPATVAASAVAGEIVDPGRYLNEARV